MRIQLLSDLHLETETFDPEPASGAELLVLAGDIDSTWAALERFRDWPQPVLFVAGNHEFDGRDVADAWPALRAHCTACSIRLLECEQVVLAGDDGRRVRFVGTTRWSDFDAFGPAKRSKAMRAAHHYLRLMNATRDGAAMDASLVRKEALTCKAWLTDELARSSNGEWDATAVITHFAPSLRSADPRYGRQNGTASFCNADDGLLAAADLWIHGHLHCAHDYRVDHDDGSGRSTRVVCNARGHAWKGEAARHQPHLLLDV